MSEDDDDYGARRNAIVVWGAMALLILSMTVGYLLGGLL